MQEKTDSRISSADDGGGFNPTKLYSDGTYMESNRDWHAEDSPWKARQIAKLLRKHQLSPRRICEVGCGAGEILQQLSTIYPDSCFVGFERSPQAMAMCKAKESERVHYRAADVFEDDEVYDCLLCIDVFEHVEDYMGFITELRGKARYKLFHIPLDISLLSVMHSSMLRARKSVGHLHYFTQETAAATLVDCGHTVIDGFLTAPFAALPARSFKARLASAPRKALFSLSPSLTAKTLGGCGYLVLTQ